MSLVQSIEQDVVKAATEIGGTSEVRDTIVYAAAELLPFVVVGVGAWIFFRGGKTKTQKERNQNVILIALAAVLIAIGVLWLVGEVVQRDRPFLDLRDIHFLDIANPDSNSFPSFHAIVLFAFVGTIYFIGHHPRWSWVLLLLCCIIIFARLVAGVHYPTDLLAGAILGLLIAKLLSWQSGWLEGQMK